MCPDHVRHPEERIRSDLLGERAFRCRRTGIRCSSSALSSHALSFLCSRSIAGEVDEVSPGSGYCVDISSLFLFTQTFRQGL
jgi:hypothetical protein